MNSPNTMIITNTVTKKKLSAPVYPTNDINVLYTVNNIFENITLNEVVKELIRMELLITTLNDNRKFWFMKYNEINRFTNFEILFIHMNQGPEMYINKSTSGDKKGRDMYVQTITKKDGIPISEPQATYIIRMIDGYYNGEYFGDEKPFKDEDNTVFEDMIQYPRLKVNKHLPDNVLRSISLLGL